MIFADDGDGAEEEEGCGVGSRINQYCKSLSSSSAGACSWTRRRACVKGDSSFPPIMAPIGVKMTRMPSISSSVLSWRW